MSWRGTDGRIYPDGVGPSCECGEKAMTPVEEYAGRCEDCDSDQESRAALTIARGRVATLSSKGE
ncbi:MAG: hypothetical protein ACI807_003948 [Paracoccaceae bacterium]|jgi:hypothetical protein